MRELYRRYPYPPIEASEGDGALDFAVLGALDYVRHLFWPGRRSLAGLRVLDAGCGTGVVAVQIARDYPEVEVTAIDVSEASLAVARERAQRQGVGGNLTFEVGRIEELALPARDPAFGDAGYDYIVASGVLHHLADPALGARRLAALLAPTGGMAVMLYATHGRFAVYLMQELLRRLAGDAPLDRQVALARGVMQGLPACHPFAAANFPDHKWQSDAGLVDLLLHPRDRSYTVPEVLALIGGAGLRLERFLGAVRYQPELYLADDDARARVADMPPEERYAIAELLHGAMSQHTFFATRPAYRPARAPAQGMALMVQRARRTPLMRWSEPLHPRPGSSATLRPRAAMPALPERAVVEDFPLDPLIRRFELDGWNLEVVAAFDGALTGLQVFELPRVQASLPGKTRQEKLETYGSFLQELAAQEVLLFEP